MKVRFHTLRRLECDKCGFMFTYPNVSTKAMLEDRIHEEVLKRSRANYIYDYSDDRRYDQREV